MSRQVIKKSDKQTKEGKEGKKEANMKKLLMVPFIVLALLWAWKVDNFKPDKYDIIGAMVALIGVCIIMYMPRK